MITTSQRRDTIGADAGKGTVSTKAADNGSATIVAAAGG